MPNWCNNTFNVFSDKENIDKFEKFLNENDGKNWFDFFLPCPKELQDVGNVSLTTGSPDHEQLIEKYGYSDWYSFGLGEWGCKWNCDAEDWVRYGNCTIEFRFDSPWAPPIKLYEYLYENGWDVNVEYHEEGMGFVGRFVDGSDEYYEYSDINSLDGIPEELIENWGIRDMLEDREGWDDEDDENDEENDDGK